MRQWLCRRRASQLIHGETEKSERGCRLGSYKYPPAFAVNIARHKKNELRIIAWDFKCVAGAERKSALCGDVFCADVYNVVTHVANQNPPRCFDLVQRHSQRHKA